MVRNIYGNTGIKMATAVIPVNATPEKVEEFISKKSLKVKPSYFQGHLCFIEIETGNAVAAFMYNSTKTVMIGVDFIQEFHKFLGE
jgi:hypothetical protein